MNQLLKLIAVFAAAACGCAATDCATEAASCRFYLDEFKDTVPTYNACSTRADKKFTGNIMARNGDTIGVVNSVGPVTYLDATDGNFKPLANLNKYLSPTQFKPYTRTTDATLPDGTAIKANAGQIGREKFQRSASKNRVVGQCIKVPFSTWQVIDPLTGNVVFNADSTNVGLDTSCVVFQFATTRCTV
ncbi:hypothetical protein JKP88DRAFT_244421 [Tribonema minus]|uniref:Uncharacterized protein n=1 Tax=Tribonema minus TaxID=303371 RepID=A0A835Z8D5_9STRA|nr:hypothetical protein JKP88DRAFT_244421 [Tribonema minus]